MRNVVRTVALAVSPVVAVYTSVFAMQVARVPFPPEADASAWPAWLLFGGLVFAINAALVYGARRLSGPAADEGIDRRSPAS